MYIKFKDDKILKILVGVFFYFYEFSYYLCNVNKKWNVNGYMFFFLYGKFLFCYSL